MASLLKKGSEGADVQALQSLLNQTRWPVGAVTGQFDATTEASVRVMQRYASLQVDGIVGPNSRKALTIAVLDGLPDVPVTADAELKDADTFSLFMKKVSLRLLRSGAVLQNAAVKQIAEATAVASRGAKVAEEGFRLGLAEVLREPAAKLAEEQAADLPRAKAVFEALATPDAQEALKALALLAHRMGSAGRGAEVKQATVVFLDKVGVTAHVLALLAASPRTVSLTVATDGARMGVTLFGTDGAISEIGVLRSTDPTAPSGVQVGLTPGAPSRLANRAFGAPITSGEAATAMAGFYWVYDWDKALEVLTTLGSPASPDLKADFLGLFLGRASLAGALLEQPAAELLKVWP